MRTEELFVAEIGDSLNSIIGHPKGHFVYKGLKRRVQKAMEAAGADLMEPFTRPVILEFYPKVVRGPSGQVSKQYDCLNFGITLKIIEDHLVRFGIITDDNRDWVHGAFCHRAELAHDGIEGIRVTITETEASTIGVQNALDLIEQAPF